MQSGNDQELQYRSFYNGNLQSIGPIGGNGKKRYTVGVCLPGTYEFIADLGNERITLVEGACYFNGRFVSSGQTILIPRGQKVVLRAEETCAYFCRFEH